jgi:hypothetical protein
MLARQLALLKLLALLTRTYAVDAGQCDDASCRSSNGNDCCSAKNFGEETMMCENDLTPVRTTTECSDEPGWVYQCCNQTAKILASGECDELRCSSDGDDCCAGPEEAQTCRPDRSVLRGSATRTHAAMALWYPQVIAAMLTATIPSEMTAAPSRISARKP